MNLKIILRKIWRDKWKTLLGLIIFGVLSIIATYSLYNYTTKRAFLNFEASWTARGETLNIQDLLPPKPRKEDNFFQSPSFLAEKNNEHSTELGHPKHKKIEGFNQSYSAYSATNAGDYRMGISIDITYWLASAKKPPRPNHTKRKTQKSRHTPSTQPKPQPTTPNLSEKDTALACLKFLHPYENRLSALAHDAQRPHAHTTFTSFDDGPTQTLEFYTPIQNTLNIFNIRSILRIMVGDAQGASEDLSSMMRMQKHTESFNYLLGDLLYLSILKTMEPTLWEGLHRQVWDDATLARFEAELTHIDLRKTFLQKMRQEICFTYCVTKKTLDDPDYLKKKKKEFPFRQILGLLDENDAESWSAQATEHVINAISEPLLIALGTWNLEIHQNSILYPNGIKATSITVAQYELAKKQLPADLVLKHIPEITKMNWLPRQIERTLHAQADIHNIRTAIALERYHLKHQAYPEKLADLVPDYLPKELEDVITGNPLHYRIKPDGTPLIYSIGINGKDDGGNPNQHPNHGDWAWMYSPPTGFTYADYRARD